MRACSTWTHHLHTSTKLPEAVKLKRRLCSVKSPYAVYTLPGPVVLPGCWCVDNCGRAQQCSLETSMPPLLMLCPPSHLDSFRHHPRWISTEQGHGCLGPGAAGDRPGDLEDTAATGLRCGQESPAGESLEPQGCQGAHPETDGDDWSGLGCWVWSACFYTITCSSPPDFE